MPGKKPKTPRPTKEKRFTMGKHDVLVNKGEPAAVVVRYERAGDLRLIHLKKR